MAATRSLAPPLALLLLLLLLQTAAGGCPPKAFCFPSAKSCKSCVGPIHAPCNATTRKSLPTFCDPTAPTHARASELVSKLTLAEKISQLSNGKPPAAIERLGIPAWQWWSEASHGIAYSAGVAFRAPTPSATSFPEQIGTAATFDSELFGLIGEAVGAEARAMMNAGNAGGTFWAPNINIVRDARWGRTMETPGECPVLTSTLAALFVSHFQRTGLASATATDGGGGGGEGDAEAAAVGELPLLRASSACKHYAAYDLESWKGSDRHHFNAIVNMQDWRDTYEPIFQSCVVDGNVSGIMCR